MKRPMLLLAVVFAFTAITFAQPNDNDFIKLQYAKAQYMNQVGILEKGKPELLATDKLEFALSNFKSGPLTGNQPISTLSTPPAGHPLLVLMLGGESYAHDNNPPFATERSLQAKWQPSTTPDTRGWDTPISEVTKDYPWADHYVTYQVTARFQGKSETYQASFIFGGGKAGAMDMITTVGSVQYTTLKEIYPEGLLRAIRDNAGVIDWLKGNQVSNVTCRNGELCCDPSSMKCGLTPVDLTKELAAPQRRSPERLTNSPSARQTDVQPSVVGMTTLSLTMAP